MEKTKKTPVHKTAEEKAVIIAKLLKENNITLIICDYAKWLDRDKNEVANELWAYDGQSLHDLYSIVSKKLWKLKPSSKDILIDAVKKEGGFYEIKTNN